MKTAGIVTWYRGANFGSVLQAFATGKAIESLGWRVRFIRSFERPFSLKNIRINLFSLLGIRRRRPLAGCPFPVQRRRFEDFLRKNFPETLPVGPCAYRRMLRGTDVFLAGGDQIWNCRVGFNPFLFLDFAGPVRRSSYGSSTGTGDVPPECRDAVKALLGGFACIGVREESSREAIAAATGRSDIRTVPDPVFLPGREFWAGFAAGSRAAVPQEPYLFCYFVGKASRYEGRIPQALALCGARKAVLLPSNDYPLEQPAEVQRIEDAGPAEFVALLAGAAAVLTDSFHGSAFSLIFGKDFYNVKRFDDSDPASQNARLRDLCAGFGLGSRFLEDGVPAAIGSEAAGRKIEEARQEGLRFLGEALG